MDVPIHANCTMPIGEIEKFTFPSSQTLVEAIHWANFSLHCERLTLCLFLCSHSHFPSNPSSFFTMPHTSTSSSPLQIMMTTIFGWHEVKEMEDEAADLWEIQAKVEKKMGFVQGDSCLSPLRSLGFKFYAIFVLYFWKFSSVWFCRTVVAPLSFSSWRTPYVSSSELPNSKSQSPTSKIAKSYSSLSRIWTMFMFMFYTFR